MDSEIIAVGPPEFDPDPSRMPPQSVSLSHATILAEARARSPARILTGRAGAAYRTATWLDLRCDHATARDAVCAELDLDRDLGASFLAEWAIFEVATLAR